MIKLQSLKRKIFTFYLLPFYLCVAAVLGMVGQEKLALQTAPQAEPHLETTIAASKPRADVSQMPVRRLQVKVWGGMATYKTLEAEIREGGNRVDFWLKIQPHHRAVREYHESVPTQDFEAFWNKLQQLNAAHLPDGFPGEAQANGSVGDLVIDAQSYAFTLQDRQQNLDHHFNVYAPEYLEDKRYQAVTAIFYEFLKSVFGDRPFSELTQ